jgi:hypothetical protein
LAVRGPWAWRILNRLSAAGCTCSPRLDTFTGPAFPPPPPAAVLANSLTAVANISIYPALLSPSLCLRPSSLRLSLVRSLQKRTLSLPRDTHGRGFCNASAGTAISRWTSNECTSLHPHCKPPKSPNLWVIWSQFVTKLAIFFCLGGVEFVPNLKLKNMMTQEVILLIL